MTTAVFTLLFLLSSYGGPVTVRVVPMPLDACGSCNVTDECGARGRRADDAGGGERPHAMSTELCAATAS